MLYLFSTLTLEKALGHLELIPFYRKSEINICAFHFNSFHCQQKEGGCCSAVGPYYSVK